MNRHRSVLGKPVSAHARPKDFAEVVPRSFVPVSHCPANNGPITMAERLNAERQVSQIRQAVNCHHNQYSSAAHSATNHRTSHSTFGSTAAPQYLVRHVRRNNNRKVMRGIALTLAGVVAFGAVGVGVAANRLAGNLVSVDLNKLMQHDRPQAPTAEEVAAYVVAATSDEIQPAAVTEIPLDSTPAIIPLNPMPMPQSAGLNILVMGTDGRGGENQALGGGDSTGSRSDSTILLHISGDHQWVAAISIPRDTMVNIPSCPTTSGKYIAAHPYTRFNAAFSYGAAAGKDIASGAICTLTTVEQITGIRVDGFVALDFAGFKGMVDALGGVEMNIPNRINSPLAGGLKLDPGVQTLDGWHALQYARARTGQGLGGGSDLGRIARQQQLIGAIAHQVLATNLLTDSPQLFRFLDATTSSMTTSSNYASINGLAELASALSNVDPEGISFLTAPIYTNPEDPNTVLLAPKAKILWDNIRYDQRPEIG